MSSNGRTGVTMSCSIVPVSFSRTTAIEVSIMVMTIRRRPRMPGTMKLRLLSSGLYQTRTSGERRTGRTPIARSRSSVPATRLWAWVDTIIDTVLAPIVADWLSEPSTMTPTVAGVPAARSSAKPRGTITAIAASPFSRKRSISRGSATVPARRNSPEFMNREMSSRLAAAPVLVADDGRDVPDVEVRGVAQEQELEERGDEQDREELRVPPELDELLADDVGNPAHRGPLRRLRPPSPPSAPDALIRNVLTPSVRTANPAR